MEKVDIKIKFKCNNKCSFCVQGDKRHRFKDKTFTKVKQELSEGRVTGAETIVFTGGEPTLHKDIFKLIEFSKKIGFKTVQIQTNGRMFFYKNFCKEIISAGANEFNPSLHGSTEDIHDFLTNAQGSFVQTVKGIMNLKSLGAKVITNSVLTEKNRKDLPKLGKLLTSLGVDCYQFAFPHILGSALENYKWLVPRKSKLNPWLKCALDYGLQAGIQVYTEAIPFCFMKGYEDCIAEIFMPNAKVFDADFKMNDFKNYRLTRGKVKGPNCRKCRYFSVCEGPWVEYPRLFGWDEFKPVNL
ncbi:MAG TPA: radical SAM protein [Elusimicrobiales bacterium]|nr:radical SAM protein [Elusimicrobiales bacterium]